jgi:acetyl-CoA acetyltransferase
VVRAVIVRAQLAPVDVDHVILGCLLQALAGMNVVRQLALQAAFWWMSR